MFTVDVKQQCNNNNNLHIRAVVFMLCGDLKNLPVHSFNALIIPILRDCLPDYFSVFLSFVVYLRDVSDEIWDLIESVSEGFPTYSYILNSVIYSLDLV